MDSLVSARIVDRLDDAIWLDRLLPNSDTLLHSFDSRCFGNFRPGKVGQQNLVACDSARRFLRGGSDSDLGASTPTFPDYDDLIENGDSAWSYSRSLFRVP